MSRLFISHSSNDNVAAAAFKQWLGSNGWPPEDVFLDLEDIGAGERWKEALRRANARCEAVILLASPEALSSPECLAEVRKAEDYGKEIIVVLLRDLNLDDSRLGSYRERQIVDLSASPLTHVEKVKYRGEQQVLRFNGEALAKVKDYLVRRGITPDHFAWPPEDKPNADPFPGLAAFTEDDAGIFFGRDADILRGLDKLRVLRRDGRPRFLLIHGPSGAGKSSYMRAGLWPRLNRDPDFAPIAIVRAARGILTGPDGLGRKLAQLVSRPRFPVAPGRVHAILSAQDEARAQRGFVRLMQKIAAQARKARRIGDKNARAPALVIAVDQAEELLERDDGEESARFLSLLANLLASPPRGVDVYLLMAIRAEAVDRMFSAIAELQLEPPESLLLPALAATSYGDIILKPIEVLARRGQRLTIDPALTAQLVNDTSGADALPLLAFTLSQLYQDFSAAGSITLADYELMGGVGGAINRAVAAARARPDEEPSIPAGEAAQLVLIRMAFIPWLARVDPQSGSWTRRVARLEEIPQGSRNLVRRLIRARLLVADRKAGIDVIEVAHESLLRQWAPLRGWLEAEAGNFKLAEDIERAAAEWKRNAKQEDWLDHRGARLAAAEKIAARADFGARLNGAPREYLAACHALQSARRRAYLRGGIAALFAVVAVLVAWWQQPWLAQQAYWLRHVRGQVLSAEAERARKPMDFPFKECTDCPEMVVVPAGTFLMGSLPGQGANTEQPQHRVTIARPFAVAIHELTFSQWDACATHGDCNGNIGSGGWGRDRQPAINVSWEDAQRYVAWLSRVTGRPYRLLSEAEWEYAARANTSTQYFFGNDEAPLGDYGWYFANSDQQPQAVGGKKPNVFGLYDMYGNVAEWVEDCNHDTYKGAPGDGGAWVSETCRGRVIRGGSWIDRPRSLRSAARDWFNFDEGRDTIGFRVARTLAQ